MLEQVIRLVIVIRMIEANKMHYLSTLFDTQLYTFRTNLLSIIRSLDTVFTTIVVCRTEIFKWVKLLVCVCIYLLLLLLLLLFKPWAGLGRDQRVQ